MKKDYLKIVFLGMSVIDMILFSLVSYFLLTILFICLVLFFISFIYGAIVLLGVGIKYILDLKIVSLGYIGTSIIGLLLSELTIYLILKLLQLYKLVYKIIKEFITSKKVNTTTKSKTNKYILNGTILSLAISLILLFITLITNNISPIYNYIENNFNGDRMAEIFIHKGSDN